MQLVSEKSAAKVLGKAPVKAKRKISAKPKMKIRKLKEKIGAEVIGLDLRKPIDAETRYLLNRALVDHVALVIRDQKFKPEQYFNAMMLFGEPMEQDSPQFSVPGAPMLRTISNRNQDSKGNRIKVGLRWHTDHTNQYIPPKYTSLYAVKLPKSGGGNTSVCNMRAAYEALPKSWKKKIDGRRTANVRLGSAVKNVYNTNSLEEQQRLKPKPVFQPLIRTNGDNGTKALYCHPNKMDYIEGYTPEESQDLIDKLVKMTTKDEFIYSHKWQLGDMLIWDDRSSMHQAAFDYDPKEHRLMWRALVRGELPH